MRWRGPAAGPDELAVRKAGGRVLVPFGRRATHGSDVRCYKNGVKALFGSVVALALTACTGGSPSGGPQPVGSCSKLNASCLYAPGKLGLCVTDERPRDCGSGPCAGDPPLVCASQH